MSFPNPGCSLCEGKGSTLCFDGVSPAYDVPCSCLSDRPYNWLQWHESQKPTILEVKEVGFTEIAPWKLGVFDGHVRLHRPHGGERETFYSVGGFRITKRFGEDDVRTWDQPMNQPLGDGTIVLFQVEADDPLYLVTAQESPGWRPRHHVTQAPLHPFLVGPSMFGSAAKLGRKSGLPDQPARIDLARGAEMVFESHVVNDPNRFFNGADVIRLVQVSREQLGTLTPDEFLVTRIELCEIMRSGLGSPHLAAVVSMLSC